MMLPLLILPVLLQLSLQSSSSGWSRVQAIERLNSTREVGHHEIKNLKLTLRSPDVNVRIAALRFWRVQSDEVLQCMWEAQEENATRDPRQEHDQFVGTIQEVVTLVNSSIDFNEPTVSREAMRTMLAMSTPVEVVCPPAGRCGTGMERTFEYHTLEPLRKRRETQKRLFLPFLEDPNPTVRLNAYGVLTVQEKKARRTKMLQMLANPDPRFRGLGLYLFAPASDADLIAVAGPLLTDPDEDVRLCASSALGGLQDPVKAYKLRSQYTPEVRECIAAKIDQSDFPDRVEMLKQLLRDPSGDVRAVAVGGLSGSSYDKKPAVLHESDFRDLLGDSSAKVRTLALSNLFRLNTADRTELVKTGLLDDSPEMREAASSCAGRLEDLSLTPYVISALEKSEDSDYMLCWYFSNEKNHHMLDSWARSPHVSVRRTLALAFSYGEERSRAAPLMKRLKSDSDPKVVDFVISWLGHDKTPESANLLHSLAAKAKGDQLVSVIYALGNYGDDSTKWLLKRFTESKDRNTRRAARLALQQAEAEVPPRDY